MHAPKHYSQAPITEAAISLRLELPDDVTLATLTDVHLAIKAAYPMSQDILAFQGQMLAGASVGATASQTQIGYNFLSSDQKHSFQARLDGFTFSRLAPYERWETFRDEAQRLWNIYRSVANPKSISRLALRYINRLDFPLPLDDLKDYLRTVPEVSADLPQGLSGYFMQLQIPQVDLTAMLLLNQAIIPPQNPNVVSVLLDIDLFRDSDFPSEEKALWEILEQLHIRTDQVFEACITDRTRELIN
ncbi:TIGR04255 family protein [Microcoleus sp. FACHB-831]|uniref:TIGR04255 family protein n=1 Tax=Microcoleus sp. FACHB-831 TaxID=2692827 RepID=UPI0016824DAD|nr:TIGR04255 family protein [Microcoleus sp. FACHB-831]MBD1923548.1 TIGR04255 family protein [Microcoleus sp. FACHB-831]